MNFTKTKSFSKFFIITFLVMICFSCKNNDAKFVKEWQSKKIVIPHTAYLNIKSDYTFEYKDAGCQWKSNSFGNWKVINDTLILNNIPSKECQFIIGFGNNAKMINFGDNFKPEVTIKGCNPDERNGEYLTFTNDKFYIKNDTLEYVTKIKFQFNDRIAFFQKSNIVTKK